MWKKDHNAFISHPNSSGWSNEELHMEAYIPASIIWDTWLLPIAVVWKYLLPPALMNFTSQDFGKDDNANILQGRGKGLKQNS